MTTHRNALLFAATTTLALSLFAGCTSDDEDDSNGGSGRPTAGAPDSGGTSGGGTTSLGGADSGEAGAPVSVGGQPGGTGGTSAAGASAAGADTAGAGGAIEGAGGAAVLDLSDAQILLVLDTLNRGEVEAAYTALPRLVDPNVEAFAEQMIVDHSSARQSVAATAEALDLNPEPSPTQRALEGEGESQVALLRSASDAAIDATYMDLQVGAHDKALELLASLEEAADAAELAQLITTLQMAVHDHHESAVTIKEEL